MYHRGENVMRRILLLVLVVVLCISGTLSITVYAFNSSLKAEFDTPEDWKGSVILQGHYNHKHQYVPDPDSKKTYAYEYKRGLGQMALKYGNTDMYCGEEDKPGIPREEFDTNYYYENGFKIKEKVLSSAKDYIDNIGGNDYAVSDEMAYVTYVHAENGVVHRFKFWNCSEKEIKDVLGSVKYPPKSAVAAAEKDNKEQEDEKKGSNLFQFFIIAAIVVMVIIWLIKKMRIPKEIKKQNDSENSEKHELQESLSRQNTIEEISEDECSQPLDFDNAIEDKNLSERDSSPSLVNEEKVFDEKSFLDAVNEISKMRSRCLDKDPLYRSKSAWMKYNRDGDAYPGDTDFYKLKDNVSLEDAIEIIAEMKEYCVLKQSVDYAYKWEIDKIYCVRVDDESIELPDNLVAKCEKYLIKITADKGEDKDGRMYYSILEKQLYRDETIEGYGSVDDAGTIYKRYQRKIEEKGNNKKTNRFTDIRNNRKQKNTDR